MNTARSHRFMAPTAALLFGLTSGMSFADGDDKEHRDNGRHNGWYKKDKDRETPKGPKGSAISVPEPGTMVLLITGLVVVVAFARRRPSV